MPITQDRLMALISVADEVLEYHKNLRKLVTQETKLATDEFYSNAPPTQILAHLQQVEALINEPYLSPTSIETLAREREHFRLTKLRNDRAKIAATKRRNKSSNIQERYSP
jgi:hypothetical protein